MAKSLPFGAFDGADEWRLCNKKEHELLKMSPTEAFMNEVLGENLLPENHLHPQQRTEIINTLVRWINMAVAREHAQDGQYTLERHPLTGSITLRQKANKGFKPIVICGDGCVIQNQADRLGFKVLLPSGFLDYDWVMVMHLLAQTHCEKEK